MPWQQAPAAETPATNGRNRPRMRMSITFFAVALMTLVEYKKHLDTCQGNIYTIPIKLVGDER
jgi:hypothetical protein